jgi:hypothetical protein
MSAAKALFYSHRRDPAKLAADLFYVYDPAADVVDVPAIHVSRFDSCSLDLQNHASKLIDSRFAAGADIVDLPISLGHESGQQSGFYGVVDVGEVSRLLSVAVNAWGLSGSGCFEELRNYPAIGVVGALARAIYVRVAHHRVDRP